MEKEIIKQLHEEWRAVVQAFGKRLKPILHSHNVTRVDSIIMLTIHKGNARTKAELAERLHFEPASLTRSLNRLVKHGLIKRYPDPTDKRFVRLELTASGGSLTKALEKNMLAIWKSAFQHVTREETLVFIKLLQGIQRNLR